MRLRLNAPWMHALLIFIFVYLLAIGYGYRNFYGDPWSIFYNEKKAYEYKYTQYRIDQAQDFISAFESSPYALTKAAPNPTLCAAFLAEVRGGQQYIKNAVSSAIEGLTTDERENILIHVQFSHTNPSVHPDWNDPWLLAAADSVHSYNTTNELFARIQFLESINDFREKGVVDYTEAMQRCHDSGAEYIAIFEDDVILANGWFAQTYQGLLDIEDKMRNDDREFISLRLFDQERSFKWEDADQESWYKMFISITVVFLVVSIALRLKSSRARYHLDNLTLLIITFIVIPSFMIFYIKSGKYAMLAPSSGAHEVGIGCCAQGIVFPRIMVPRLRSWLRNKEYGWLDLLINNFSTLDKIDFVKYELYPPQMQHVGMQAVHGTKVEDERRIHNAAFERLNPKALERQHKDLVKKLYPE